MRLFPVIPAAFVVSFGVVSEPTPARAQSPVVIEGADEDMREALEDVLPERERPTTLFEAERLAEEAAERALLWLRSEGYYQAEVDSEASEEPAVARILVTPGPRFEFTAPEVAYAGDAPIATAQAEVRRAVAIVDAGAPGRAETVLEAEAVGLAALQQSGYAEAQSGARVVIVDHAALTVAPEFHYQPGPLVRLGGVRAEPDDVFRQSFIERLQNWERGEVYSPEAMTRLRRDLTSTGAVSLVTTELAPPGEDGARDIILNIEPARRHAYEIGVSYSTTEGVGLLAEWTRRNLTGRADALTVAATLAELQQNISAALARPHAAGLGRALVFGASVERETLTGFTRQGVALYGSIDASTRLELAESYGLRLSYDEFDDLAGGVREALVLSGFGSVRHNTTENRLDPRDGSIVELRLEPAVSSGDETLGFARAIAEGRVYESFGDADRTTLAARLRTGWLEAVAGDVENVPPDRRFYAGGGGSVRGYEYNSLYPRERDLLGLTPGGQGLVEGSIEARWRSEGRWGAVAFVDAGTAFDDWSEATDLSYSVGVGVRYDLGFAPLRADIAIPLDEERADEGYALYISLGQAF